MKAEVSFRVYSTAKDLAGNWSYNCVRRFPVRPVPGDFVVLAPGWASGRVKDVTFVPAPGDEDELHVELEPVKTDDPATVREHEELLELGWHRCSGPWNGALGPDR